MANYDCNSLWKLWKLMGKALRRNQATWLTIIELANLWAWLKKVKVSILDWLASDQPITSWCLLTYYLSVEELRHLHTSNTCIFIFRWALICLDIHLELAGWFISSFIFHLKLVNLNVKLNMKFWNKIMRILNFKKTFLISLKVSWIYFCVCRRKDYL